MLLKVGDWVLKTKRGWKRLKKSDEIDAYLNHHLVGDLFIFDALERKGGRVVLKGHFFNEMRTQKQKITVPIVSEKKAKRPKRKKIFK